jgi:predicted nicotinamide N-methyase
MDPEKAEFVRANTAVMAPPHVPEIALHLADEAHDLWHRTEEELHEIGLEPPFWAFAWAGGQGLARYVLDHPDCVKGRRVLDFATGSGLVAIAAARAGAAQRDRRRHRPVLRNSRGAQRRAQRRRNRLSSRTT